AWLAARGSSVYPTPDDRTIEALLRTNASTFVFRRAPGSLDWAPVAIAPKLRHLLGPEAPIGPDLARRRIAVRLRRLFEAVSLAGEPLEAHFGQTEHGTRTAEIEVLVAPLSSDGSTVDCILGSLDISPCAPSPGRLHLHQAPSAHLPMLFALGSSKALGEAVATCLAVELSPCEERSFEDGEHKSRSLVDVRGRDVCVLHSLHGDSSQSANDKLCRTLFFVGSLKDAGARHVSVLAPYLCYSRKDRITKARDPVTTRYVATLFEAVGTDHLATVDVHNP
ncbi:ribose-phosphate pyrophosphokinase-like domain-containing protein, partial [Nostoc sp. NIES-2111]